MLSCYNQCGQCWAANEKTLQQALGAGTFWQDEVTMIRKYECRLNVINWLWQRNFIHEWLKCRNPFYLFIISFPSNSFYTLPIIQRHQILLRCCHIQTTPKPVNCCRRTQILSSSICFNYFCWVTTNAQFGRASFTVVTLSRGNNKNVTLLHSSIPTDFGQQQ